MSVDEEILKEYLIEARENLDRASQALLKLEETPEDSTQIDSAFRGFHSIKGAAGFFNLKKLETITHKAENLLNAVREKKISISTEVISALLKSIDEVSRMLSDVEKTGMDGNDAPNTLIELLIQLTSGSAVAAAISTTSSMSVNEKKDSPQTQQAKKIEPTDSTIRVNVQLLDHLLDLVGELVLSRNEILQISNSEQITSLVSTCQHLSRITSELQEKVMSTRMQPISNVWNNIPRIVRDLSLSVGKKIKVQMEGKETELDKTIIESLKDPLTHLVRNSVDHGIETPEKRKTAGKNEEGLFQLKATHKSGFVIIEIIDDGAGIDPERVKKKALEKGLLTQEEAIQLSVTEAQSLIFAAGFSTAEAVSNISGRGVGMDVVRTNIEKIGGTIELASIPGKGTTFTLKIPLTLAIVPALIFHERGNNFAIPQSNVKELIRIKPDKILSSIEFVHNMPVYRLREHLLPLVMLEDILSNKSDSSFKSKFNSQKSVNIVVLQISGEPFGLIVDEIIDSQEIVVKPLGDLLKGISLYSGATLLGDGNIAIILDAAGVANSANVASAMKQSSAARHEDRAQESKSEQSLLLVQSPDDGRLAIPLDQVTRLEKFKKSKVERTGGLEVIQYEEKVMPLVWLASLLPERRKNLRNQTSVATHNSEILETIVLNINNRNIGLVVDHILDIINESIETLNPPSRKGILGTCIIRERVTELLDVNLVINQQLLEHVT